MSRSDCDYPFQYDIKVFDADGNEVDFPDWLEFDDTTRTLSTTDSAKSDFDDLGTYTFESEPRLIGNPITETSSQAPQQFSLELNFCEIDSIEPSYPIENKVVDISQGSSLL